MPSTTNLSLGPVSVGITPHSYKQSGQVLGPVGVSLSKSMSFGTVDVTSGQPGVSQRLGGRRPFAFIDLDGVVDYVMGEDSLGRQADQKPSA